VTNTSAPLTYPNISYNAIMFLDHNQLLPRQESTCSAGLTYYNCTTGNHYSGCCDQDACAIGICPSDLLSSWLSVQGNGTASGMSFTGLPPFIASGPWASYFPTAFTITSASSVLTIGVQQATGSGGTSSGAQASQTGSPAPNGGGGSNHAGLIAGLVVAGVIILALIAAVVFLFRRKRRSTGPTDTIAAHRMSGSPSQRRWSTFLGRSAGAAELSNNDALNMSSPPPRYDEESGPAIVSEVKGSEVERIPAQMLDGAPVVREMDASDNQLHELPGSEIPSKYYPVEKHPLDTGVSPSFRHISPVSGSLSANDDQSVSALASIGPRSVISEKSISEPSEPSEVSVDSPIMRNAFTPVLSPPTEQEEIQAEQQQQQQQEEQPQSPQEGPVVARRSWIANILRRDRERRDNEESKPKENFF